MLLWHLWRRRVESFQTTRAREDETRGVGGSERGPKREEDGEEKSEEEKKERETKREQRKGSETGARFPSHTWAIFFRKVDKHSCEMTGVSSERRYAAKKYVFKKHGGGCSKVWQVYFRSHRAVLQRFLFVISYLCLRFPFFSPEFLCCFPKKSLCDLFIYF